MALRLDDVDWQAGKITVRSPKTEHHEGKKSRVIPLFPELRPHLEEAAREAEAVGSEFFVTKFRKAGCNKRTTLAKIIQKAGLKPWPKLFQNLRQSRVNEVNDEFPSHVATEWMGHDAATARKFYLRADEDDFAKAIGQLGGTESGTVAAHIPAQQPPAGFGNLSHTSPLMVRTWSRFLHETARIRRAELT